MTTETETLTGDSDLIIVNSSSEASYRTFKGSLVNVLNRLEQEQVSRQNIKMFYDGTDYVATIKRI